MLRSKAQRSIVAPLLLGGMLLAWEDLWKDLAAWLRGSPEAVTTSDYSSGIDPLGRPNGTNTGSGEPDYSSGIDPDGRP